VYSFDNILVAGKAGILLSALSASQQLSMDRLKVETLARASNISVPFELPRLLELLQQRNLINLGTSGIDVLGVTGVTVLERAAELFEELNPRGTERAALELAEQASLAPVAKDDVSEYISDTLKLTRADLAGFFEQAEDIGFVDCEQVDSTRRLYFNGNLFRRDLAGKVERILSTLSSNDKKNVDDVDERLRKFGCLPLDEVKTVLGNSLFEKLTAISMYDVNVVNNSKEDVAFITRPAAFSKFGNALVSDALDLAKAFVSSLTYGMTRSGTSRGRIQMIEKLLAALIRGEWVGSATAIGEDYRALELRNVIEVRAGETYGHDMRLLKRDVGEMALAVIQSGDTSDRSLPRIPGAPVSYYVGPEVNRQIVRKKQSASSKRATRDMVMVLRTGKLS
jgi:hypothetical protein